MVLKENSDRKKKSMFKTLHISLLLMQIALGEKYYTKCDNGNHINFVKNVFSKTLYEINIYIYLYLYLYLYISISLSIYKIFLGLGLLTRRQYKERSNIFKIRQLASHQKYIYQTSTGYLEKKYLL